MSYPDGSEVKVGDLVWWNEGTRVGRIALIVQSEEELAAWGLTEPGIFICNDCSDNTSSCDVFNAANQLADEGVGPLARHESAQIAVMHKMLIESRSDVSQAQPFRVHRLCNSQREVEWRMQILEPRGQVIGTFEFNPATNEITELD